MRPRGPIFLLALAIVATFVVYTWTSRPVAAALPPRPERHVLDNGVRVIIQDHRVSDVVALQLSHISLPGREVAHRYVRAVEAVVGGTSGTSRRRIPWAGPRSGSARRADLACFR